MGNFGKFSRHRSAGCETFNAIVLGAPVVAAFGKDNNIFDLLRKKKSLVCRALQGETCQVQVLEEIKHANDAASYFFSC